MTKAVDNFVGNHNISLLCIAHGQGTLDANHVRPMALPLVIKRMPVRSSVHATEVVALDVRDIEVLQSPATKCAIGREVQLLPSRIIKQYAPLSIRIYLNDLICWSELPVFGH